MKKFIFLFTSFLALVLLCYFLLFISLDITAMFMESDDDINKTGKTVLFVMPGVIFFGLWLANYMRNALKNNEEVSHLNRIFISVYGGLFGMVIFNLLLKLFMKNNNETIFILSLLVPFVVFIVIASVLTNKHLTRKINSDS